MGQIRIILIQRRGIVIQLVSWLVNLGWGVCIKKTLERNTIALRKGVNGGGGGLCTIIGIIILTKERQG